MDGEEAIKDICSAYSLGAEKSVILIAVYELNKDHWDDETLLEFFRQEIGYTRGQTAFKIFKNLTKVN